MKLRSPKYSFHLWRQIWPPLLPLLVITFTLEFLVTRGFIPTYIFPAPSEIWTSLLEDYQEYLNASISTLKASFLGLILSSTIGICIALIMSSSHLVERAFYPYALFFQTVPIISIAPLLVIWFGFGLPTVIVSSFIVSIFPVIANTLSGMHAASPSLHDLFRLYSAGRWNTLFKLQLPSAVPQIITGIRIASGLSMIGAIVGEFIAGGGLGGLIDMARTQQRLDKVFSSVLIATFLGLVILSFLNSISRLFLKRWEESK